MKNSKISLINTLKRTATSTSIQGLQNNARFVPRKVTKKIKELMGVLLILVLKRRKKKKKKMI